MIAAAVVLIVTWFELFLVMRFLFPLLATITADPDMAMVLILYSQQAFVQSVLWTLAGIVGAVLLRRIGGAK